MNTAARTEKPNGFSRIYTPLFALFVVFFLWGGPDAWQRILLSLALFLSYKATISGYNHKGHNWVDGGVTGFYSGLMGATWGSIVAWKNSGLFWDNSPLLFFMIMLLTGLFATFDLNRNGKSTVPQIVNVRSTFGSIAALLVLGGLGAYFRPELSIAQLGSVLVGIGFAAQPFAQSKEASLITPRRVAYGALLAMLVVDLL